MRFTCSQFEVHVFTEWGSRVHRLMFTYSQIEVHVFMITDWGSRFRSMWFVYSQIEVRVFTDWGHRYICTRTLLTQERGSRSVEKCREGSRRVEEGRGGSRRVEEGQGRTSPVDDHRKCFSCFSTNACACDYCNRALCAFYICTRTRLDAHLHSWALLDHPLHTPLIVWTTINEDGETQISLSLVDVLKISSTESRFFSLSNVFSMEFAHGDCAFDKHIRLSGHTRMILWCLI